MRRKTIAVMPVEEAGNAVLQIGGDPSALACGEERGNRICVSRSTNPYENLALEELLFDTCGDGRILYLWQNRDTVVIGRNQNAWSECRVREIEADGVCLARRRTGGGAVFHDIGNLNFTFIANEAAYDLARQLRVIADAVRHFGIETEATGRNDIVIRATGEKFSGNAFRYTQTTKMHHGTILINADGGRMQKYLTPSPEKLRAKGVSSVRARVGNLAAYNPSITPKRMEEALIAAFIGEFGPAQQQPIPEGNPRLAQMTAFYASWDWRIGASPACDLRFSHRFDWGGVELLLEVREGHVAAARAYSDALDQDAILLLEPVLIGAEARPAAMAARLRTIGSRIAEDLAAFLEQADA